MKYTIHDSPAGPLLLAADAAGLRLLSFQAGQHPQSKRPEWEMDARFFAEAIRQLDAYFAGTRKNFDLVLAPEGSPFQRRVWNELRKIPFGTTICYGELARRVHKPGAARAVGAANGANPIALIIPCHRVIGADGTLTGYGGGLEIKEKLLAHEGALLNLSRPIRRPALRSSRHPSAIASCSVAPGSAPLRARPSALHLGSALCLRR